MHSFSCFPVQCVVKIFQHLVTVLILHHTIHGVGLINHCFLPPLVDFETFLDQHPCDHFVDLKDVHADDSFDDLRGKLIPRQLYQVFGNLLGDNLQVAHVDSLDDRLDDVVAELVGREFLEVLQDGFQKDVDLAQFNPLERLRNHFASSESLRHFKHINSQLLQQGGLVYFLRGRVELQVV